LFANQDNEHITFIYFVFDNVPTEDCGSEDLMTIFNENGVFEFLD
jgi:hypothetical protein